MPEQQQKFSRSDLIYMVNQIRRNGRGLTKWENDFIQSVTSQLMFKAQLSDLMIAKLDQIYSQKTGL